MSILSSIVAQYWPYLAGGLAVVLSYFGVRWQAKSEAKAEARAESNEQAIKSMKQAQEVRNDVNQMAPGGAAAELKRDWMRKRSDGQ